MDKIDGNLRGLLLDVNAWAREGLMDSAVGRRLLSRWRHAGDGPIEH